MKNGKGIDPTALLRHRFTRPALALTAISLFHGVAGAATYTVTNTGDTDGTCGASCSLREAIKAANIDTAVDTIVFDSTAFAAPGPYTIQLESALPGLNTDLILTGPGANLLTVQGEGNFGGPDYYRFFTVNVGRTLNISGLTFSNGRAAGANGADGTGSSPTAGQPAKGGAILNSGSLALTGCVFSGNMAQGGSGGSGAGNTNQDGAAGAQAQGGAIYSDGTLTITRCTFSGNSALGGSGGSGASIQFGGGGSGNGAIAGPASGGAVYVAAGSASIVNSTFAGNSANGGFGGSGGASNFTGAARTGARGGDASGGAIYTAQPLTLTFNTLSQNSAAAGNGGYTGDFNTNAAAGDTRGGGVYAGGTVTIGNTIAAVNTVSNPGAGLALGPDLFGTFVSQNFNLIGALDSSATGINGAADMAGTGGGPLVPKLAQLKNNGGPTPTMALRKGSPAIDKGKALVSTDQRGNSRPMDLADGTYPNAAGGDGSDIGAYEAQSLPNDAPVALDQSFNGNEGEYFDRQLTATDDDSDALTYSIVTGTLPAGLTLNPSGNITGTPTAPVQKSVTFKVNDGMADSETRTLTFNIAETPSLVVDTDIDDSTAYDNLNSLREAVTYAGNDSAATPVTFSPVFFSAPKTITLRSSGGILLFGNDVDINGPAARLTISGGDTVVPFQIYGGTVGFKNLTISNGHNLAYGSGNAITLNNFGTPPIVTLTNCTLSNNGGNDTKGGAIGNSGANLTLTNCTLTGNHADDAGGSSAAGGAIYQATGSLTLNNCTVSGNHATGGNGGGLAIDGGTVTLKNSIVSGNTAATGPNIYGTINSGDYNLVQNTTGGTLAGTHNVTGQAANLEALASNGGPTQTMKPLAGSPAIDAGSNALIPAGVITDQRGAGFARVAGTSVDIGAYEVGSAPAFTAAIKTGPYSDTFAENAGEDATVVTFTRTGDTSAALTVSMRTSKPKEAAVDSTATFAAGSATVDVPVDAVNDLFVDGTKDVVVQLRTLDNVSSAEVTVHVTDVTTPALTLSLKPNVFFEDDAVGPRLQVTHNREDISQPLALTIGSSDSRLAPPAGSLQIPAGTRTASFQFSLVPVAGVQGPVTATVTVNAAGFPAATATATINERLRPVTLKVAPDYRATFPENAGAAATMMRLTRTGDVSAAVTLEARTSAPKEATVPATVTIPANATYVDFPVNAVNDTLVDARKDVTVEVRSNGEYGGATALVRVTNVTVPQFTLELRPAAFYEDAATGPLLVVTHNLEDMSVAVPLTISTDDGRLTAPANPQIPVGSRSANIRLITAVDPGVQGSLPVKVTVDDNAFVTGFAPVSVSGTIYDREAKLTVTASPSTISESGAGGKPNASVLRITRNGSAASLAAPLAVNLTVRTGAGQVSFTSPVTIPANASYADVTVTAVADALPEGSTQVSFIAQAPGYKAGTVNILVLD